MTDALTEILRTDRQAAKCYRAMTGAEPMTLDGIASCYGATPDEDASELLWAAWHKAYSEAPDELDQLTGDEAIAYAYLTATEYAEESAGEQLARVTGVPEAAAEDALSLSADTPALDADVDERLLAAWRTWCGE